MLAIVCNQVDLNNVPVKWVIMDMANIPKVD